MLTIPNRIGFKLDISMRRTNVYEATASNTVTLSDSASTTVFPVVISRVYPRSMAKTIVSYCAPRRQYLVGMKSIPDGAAIAMAGPSDFGRTAQWLVFCLDQGRYALPLAAVDRIVRAVYVTPMPQAPGIVLGAIDVQGRVLPVFNLRRRFGLPERTVDPADHFLIAHTARRTVALVIDAAQGLIEHAATAVTPAAIIARDPQHIRGVIQLDDGLVLIHDLEHFLSPDEARVLDEAMSQQVSDAN